MSLLKIDVTIGDLDFLTKRAWKAISRMNNPPVLYRHGGRVARIEKDDQGNPFINAVDQNRLRHRLAQVTFWFKLGDVDEATNKKKEQQVRPPGDVISNMLACPDIQLPVLERIVESPVFAADGSLEISPGYSAKTRIYYQPPAGFELPALPKKPSLKDLAKAKELLLENLLFDFPFSDDANVGVQ